MSKVKARHVTSASPVLVVDDNPLDRRMVRSMLEGWSYEVIEAEGGKQCVEKCDKEDPLLVILDISMPDIDGIEVCKLVRQKYSKEDLPIVMVTGNTEGENLEAALKAGANDFISKPIDPRILRARIQNQLAFSNLYRRLNLDRESLERSVSVQRAVGDVLPEGLAVVDKSGAIVYTNQEFCSFCDERIPSLMAELPKVLFAGMLEEDLKQLVEKIREDSTHFINKEMEFKRGIESQRIIRIVSRPVANDGAGSGLRLWLFRDISHLRNLERKMTEQIKLKTVSVFATGVAHNFNNILGAVKGSTDVLKKYARDVPVVDRCFKVLDHALHQGEQLTKKMSCLTSQDARKRRTTKEDLSQLLTSIVDVQRQLVGERINFYLNLPKTLPVISADTQNVIDIITSIIKNSIESISEEGTISVEAKHMPTSAKVALEIVDNGCGMTEEVLRRVHEPFFSTKHMDHVNGISTVGNGLGLWNVYNLVKMLGGDISLQSSSGEGTKVEILFPAAT